jgi:hypothetical protein
MAAQELSFTDNLFCSNIDGREFDINGKQTQCFKGQADCRMSACLISKSWMIDNKTKALTPFGQRAVGYVFNQKKVETAWTKCSYIWDGASANNLNRGCGAGARGGNSCDPKDKSSAFYNQCGKHTCTADSPDVKRQVCQILGLGEFGGTTPVPQTHDGNPQCVFPGVAFDYHGQEGYNPGNKDGTRYMVQQRVKYNSGTGSKLNGQPVQNIVLNNEIVLDEELLLPDIWLDPVAAIPAFIYAKSNEVIAKTHAGQMRDQYCEYYHCEANGGGKPPLVMVDDTAYHPEGPFSSSGEESSMVV